MKRELTLTDIAGYLPHGLKILQCNIEKAATVFEMHYHPIKGDQRVICGINNIFKLSGIAPVLRPMSDLYVEITERGYNDGKPFIPIFRMAKIKYPEFTHFTHCNLDSGTVFMSSPQSPAVWYEYDEEKLSIGEYDLLHRLHFDYRGLIPAGLAVSVYDLLTNPYEA